MGTDSETESRMTAKGWGKWGGGGIEQKGKRTRGHGQPCGDCWGETGIRGLNGNGKNTIMIKSKKFDADLLLCWLSHFKCDSHTVHMLTQWCLLPPLTSKVIIAHACIFQSTLLGCQVIWCHANHSLYFDWTFSIQTSLSQNSLGHLGATLQYRNFWR